MPRRITPSSSLRRSLIAQASAYVREQKFSSEQFFTNIPGGVTLFKPHLHLDADVHHNFHPASYAAITNNPQWRLRLQKKHNCAGLPPGTRELDSCCSSDALLMNIFCYPQAAETLAPLFGLSGHPVVEFGVKPHLAFVNAGREPRSSEIDLRLSFGNTTVLCEAKLTEAGFTSKELASVHRYRYFRAVFDPAKLPQAEKYSHYQLIRNILAAKESGALFYLLHDARRPDLRAAFDNVLAAVKDPKLRERCRSLTWQQIARKLPENLRQFLTDKYGIR